MGTGVEFMQKIAINVCDCDGMHEDFPISIYRFIEAGDIALPDLCPNSDLTQNEITQFDLLIETTEENQNSTLYSVYSGRIARVQKNLYFYSFGDVDEIGESNFYISGSLGEVVEFLLSEWGELAPDWRGLFKKWATDGILAGYDSGTLRSWTELFLNPDPEIVNVLEGLEVALYLNLGDEELVSELKQL
jgi:hypothetical protein